MWLDFVTKRHIFSLNLFDQVLRLLLVAWDRRLIFSVGTSSTTGESDTVIWNEVHHKTEFGSNLTGHGYPDPGHLDNVLEELKAQGITEEECLPRDWAGTPKTRETRLESVNARSWEGIHSWTDALFWKSDEKNRENFYHQRWKTTSKKQKSLQERYRNCFSRICWDSNFSCDCMSQFGYVGNQFFLPMLSRSQMLFSETFETTVHIQVSVRFKKKKKTFILWDFISRM